MTNQFDNDICELIQTLPVNDPVKLDASLAKFAEKNKNIVYTLKWMLDQRLILLRNELKPLDQHTFNEVKVICTVLAKIGDQDALKHAYEKLYEFRYSSTPQKVKQAADALVAIGAYAADLLCAEFMKFPQRHVVGNEFHAYVLSRLRDARILETLVRKVDPLGDPDFYVECLAAFGMDYTETFVRFLSDEDRYVRETAAMVLGYLGDPKSVDPLISALRDVEERVRLKAIRSLSNYGGHFDENILFRFLDDESPLVQKNTIMTLKFLAPKHLISELERIIMDHGRQDYVRKAAQETLEYLREKFV